MDYIKVCKKLKLKIILSAMFSKELRELIMLNGVCPDCKEINTGWAWCNKCDPESEIVKEFSNADAIVSREYSSNEITLHPEAIYTSRHMNFRNLPKSRNSLGVQVENSEFSDPNLLENFIYDAVKEQSQEIYVITNSSYDNNNNGYHDTSECYENNEKEEDRNANSYLEDLRFAGHNYEKMSSVVVSVASKNIHEISVSSHLGKHSLNFDEEIITSTVAYKKAKHI
ncbi:18547_t:CDS:2 [Rhizophagus irregularis]|nr:18547_t:CDS:2 [Rhizophagus irregularis]